MRGLIVNPAEVVMINERKAIPATELYELLLEGFDRGYNRRAENREDYDAIMDYTRDFHMSLLSGKKRRVMRKQHPTWRTLKFPIFLHHYHFYKNGLECERHVRIGFAHLLFDVPESVRNLSVHI